MDFIKDLVFAESNSKFVENASANTNKNFMSFLPWILSGKIDKLGEDGIEWLQTKYNSIDDGINGNRVNAREPERHDCIINYFAGSEFMKRIEYIIPILRLVENTKFSIYTIMLFQYEYNREMMHIFWDGSILDLPSALSRSKSGIRDNKIAFSFKKKITIPILF